MKGSLGLSGKLFCSLWFFRTFKDHIQEALNFPSCICFLIPRPFYTCIEPCFLQNLSFWTFLLFMQVGSGLCDNLLTCIIRAWDYSKPVFVAPAMNTFMWDNPFTQKHLDQVKDLGFLIISPITKKLACGDYGNGAMAEPSVIDSTLRLSMHNRLSQVKPMVLDSI